MKWNRMVCFAGICGAVLLSACNNVTQATKKLELGSEVGMMDLLECKKGTSAIIKDRTKLDIMTIGEYDVPFVITDENGKTYEKTFTFEVVDTVAPEIISGDRITVIKGGEFNLQEAIVATDLSGDVVITSSDKVDTSIPDEYNITVVAEDKAGNVTQKDVCVDVIEREETNFRSTIWGDSLEMIDSLEPEELQSESKGTKTTAFVLSNISGIDVYVVYQLDSEYGLYKAAYLSVEEYNYLTSNRAISDYFTFNEQLVKKYGEPDRMDEPRILSDRNLVRHMDVELALSYGWIAYESEWQLPEQNTEIILDTFYDGDVIRCRVVYSDTRYEEDYSASF